jgi:DNA-binding IclR family transcriptional regulator
MVSTDLRQTPTKGESLLVRKAIAVLRLFAGGEETLSLRDVVTATGYPKTVCHRLLTTLVNERFLNQSRNTARYSLGPDLIMFARKDATRSMLLRAAEPSLVSIAKKTGDVAILHVLDDNSALCIDRRDGDYPIRTAGVHVGGRLPLHCGGGPMALLSFAPAEVVEGVLAKPLEAWTSMTVTDPECVRERISAVRKLGFAVGDEDLFDYVVAVGAPIIHNGKLVAALSVGGIKPRYDADRIAEVGELTLSGAIAVARRLDGE